MAQCIGRSPETVSVRAGAVIPTVMSNPPVGYPRVWPYLLYEDAAPAVEYLRRSFCFDLCRSEVGAAGRMHNELLLGEDGLVMLGQAGQEFSSPRTLGLLPPSMIHAYVDDVECASPTRAGSGPRSLISSSLLQGSPLHCVKREPGRGSLRVGAARV